MNRDRRWVLEILLESRLSWGKQRLQDAHRVAEIKIDRQHVRCSHYPIFESFGKSAKLDLFTNNPLQSKYKIAHLSTGWKMDRKKNAWLEHQGDLGEYGQTLSGEDIVWQ